MELERVFRKNFTPLNKEYKFTGGDKATVLDVTKPDIKISVNNKSYRLPYRDFIVMTKSKETELE
ncbi:MAG: hypothetical protein NTX65_11640 [Ignavibacteriales bacterium]|nr:hypothetical protein [Ignavibacteriales bacterium]